MNDIAEALKERTMRFAVRVVRFCRGLPDTWEGRHVRDQLFRAGTGTAANYHAACRAPSHRDFISKIGVVVEESDESVFWLKFVGEVGLSDAREREQLLREARELLAIFIQSAKTASANRY
jgi:four helix bundle protein